MRSDIYVNPASIRKDIEERFRNGEIIEPDISILRSLSDKQIDEAIDACIDNGFWELYDNLRCEVIDDLIHKYDPHTQM